MNEKIQWYREVLEIEPQARLFFPLAGLLAGEGETEEACAVLARGLAFHPGYMEARMLHVELLNRLGRHDEAAGEIRVLHRGLAEHAGFWQAWAGRGGEADEDLAMRCMALFLRGVPVSFSDLLRRGLDSLEAEHGMKAAAASAREAAPAAAAGTPDPAGTVLRPASGTATLLAAWADAPASPAAPPAGPEPGPRPAAEAADAEAADAAPAAEAGAGDVTDDAADAAPAADDAAMAPADDDGDGDFALNDGDWPPHTRSMAEVFVEQEEYGAAMDIYLDLLGRARDEKEIRELGARLEEIEAMSGAARPRPAAGADAARVRPAAAEAVDDGLTVDAGSGAANGALLSMLESLAARVEARAR